LSSDNGRTIEMSPVNADTQVATLVLEQPGRARVFERFGIDYCCGGKVPLETACTERGLDLAAVIRALEVPPTGDTEDVDWMARPVADLCVHIVGRHHSYLRDELPSLLLLADKVARAHGGTHAELVEVHTSLAALADELERHMAEEEQVVFPRCVALEERARGDVLPIESPIGALLHEHDEVAAGLSRLRALTNGYEPSVDACNSTRSLLDRLQTLEADTHRHVHEENNILFPRALALEAARRDGVPSRAT